MNPKPNKMFRFTDEEISLITALRNKMNLSVVGVIRAALHVLAAKEGIRPPLDWVI